MSENCASIPPLGIHKYDLQRRSAYVARSGRSVAGAKSHLGVRGVARSTAIRKKSKNGYRPVILGESKFFIRQFEQLVKTSVIYLNGAGVE